MADYNLNNRFTYHPPFGNQAIRYEYIRNYALEFGDYLVNVACPDSRELALAITKLEEVVFWANAAIARHEVDDSNSPALEELLKRRTIDEGCTDGE